MTEPIWSEPIWSTGGAGGERAVTEDLEWAVAALRAAADDVGAAQLELTRRRAALALDPGVGHAALIAELSSAAHLAPKLEAELEDTARRLGAVAAAYLEAERKARYRVGLVASAREAGATLIGDQVWVQRVVAALALAASPFGRFISPRTVLPHGPPPTTGILTRDGIERVLDTPTYAALVLAVDACLALTLEHMLTRWRGRLTATTIAVAPVRSLQDVMERLLDTEEVPGGAVRIERWTDPAGVVRRVVLIPGTKDWLNLTGNPFDSEADVALMAGRMPDAAAMVAAALEADGARSGDPVLLAGHSLGGIVAAALAGNADFASRFDVRAVVTAGSPTGRISLPSTVNALHLEGTRDIVPGLDGKPNPDTPTRVTVHHDARDSHLPQLKGAGEDIGSAHHLNTYAQTARLIDEGLSPSTDAWLDAERPFLEPGANLVVTQYAP